MYQYHKDGTLPQAGEVFVFGSNLAGRHGKGAALIAKERFGAQYGKGFGRMRHCYAIPTKDEKLRVMDLESIQKYIKFFLGYIKTVPEDTFFITRIGCGLAGYKDVDIAPLFRHANFNCNFPEQWKAYVIG